MGKQISSMDKSVINGCHPWMEEPHPWMKVSSVDVIHGWRNLIHEWKCHPLMSSMDGEPSSLDDIHG